VEAWSRFYGYLGESRRWWWHAQNTLFTPVSGYVSFRERLSLESTVDGIVMFIFKKLIFDDSCLLIQCQEYVNW